MKRFAPLLLLVASWAVASAGTETWCWGGGSNCTPFNPGDSCFGQVVPVCPPGSVGPNVIEREGEMSWRPPHTNYLQSPFAVKDGEMVYLGFHVGFCCPAYVPNSADWERPVLVAFGPTSAIARDPLLYPPPDTHEFGMATAVAVENSWLVMGVRTTWASWLIWQKSGFVNENRARGWAALFDNLRDSKPYKEWWDVQAPWDENCREQNTCGPGTGPHMHILLWIDNVNGFPVERKLWLFVRDDVGSMKGTSEVAAYTVTFEPEIAFHKQFIAIFQGAKGAVPLLGIAQGSGDGTLYGLVSAEYDAEGNATCWYINCTSIREWLSGDGGRIWWPGPRSWRAKPSKAPGGLPPLTVYVGDPDYLRDRDGHIDQSHRAVVSMALENPDPTSNTWRLYWWADYGVALPRTWGLEPGVAIPRRHLEKAPTP